jgi:hypothetical protein
MDETPSVWGLNPKKMYAAKGTSGDQARAPGNDDRSRFTTNCAFTAAGEALPVSFVIKCSTTDLRSEILVIPKTFSPAL